MEKGECMNNRWNETIGRREMLGQIVVGGVSVAAVGGAVVIEGCNPAQWITIVLNDLPTVLEIALSIINMIGAMQGGADPAMIAKAQAVAATVQTDLQTVQTLVGDYQKSSSVTTLGKINAAMTDCQSNLGAILAMFRVTNPVYQAEIAAALGSAMAIVTYLGSLIPTPVVPASAKMRQAQISNSDYIRSAYNTAVAAAGGTAFQIK